MKFTNFPFLSALAIVAVALPMTARADHEDKDKKHKKGKHEKHEEVRSDHRQNVNSVARALSINAAPQVHYRTERRSDHGSYQYEDAQRSYYSHPRTQFSITLGDGYRGRGYYYGPPNAAYYYEAPGVTYYENERIIPRQYRSSYGYDRGGDGYGQRSMRSSVQEALAYRGYYHGAVDGDIGPGSRRAIANFQADYGLRPTGRIDQSLVATLGL